MYYKWFDHIGFLHCALGKFKYKFEKRHSYRHHLPSDFGLFYIRSAMQSEICNRGFGLSGNLSSGSWPIGDIAIGLLVLSGNLLSGFWFVGDFVIGLLTYRGFVIGLMVIGLLAIGLMSYTLCMSSKIFCMCPVLYIHPNIQSIHSLCIVFYFCAAHQTLGDISARSQVRRMSFTTRKLDLNDGN